MFPSRRVQFAQSSFLKPRGAAVRPILAIRYARCEFHRVHRRQGGQIGRQSATAAIPEAGFAAVPLARRRAHPPEWVTEPEPIFPLLSASLTRSADRFSKSGEIPAPPGEPLLGDARRPRRFPESCPRRKLAQNESVAPIGFHGGRIQRHGPTCPPARQRTGKGASGAGGGLPCSHFAHTWKAVFRAICRTLAHIRGESLTTEKLAFRAVTLVKSVVFGGGGGIRTHGYLAASPVFKTGAIDHSTTPPKSVTARILHEEPADFKQNHRARGFCA